MRDALFLLCAFAVSPSLSRADSSLPNDPKKSGKSWKATTCGQDNNKGPATVAFPDGLQLQELVVGKGALATRGAMVQVAWTAWLASGEQIGSDRVRFRLGREVGAGIEEGIDGMRAGGKRRLHLPRELAYFNALANPRLRADIDGRFRVAPNTPLIVEVTLESVGPIEHPAAYRWDQAD